MSEETQNNTSDILPLSQETVNFLFDNLMPEQMQYFLDSQSLAFLETLPQVAPVQPARSSLPATGNWPGEYSFKVSFNPQPRIPSKQVPWTYSEGVNKLFVKKDVACPINFSTRLCMTNDVCVRAMAVFTSPEHSSEAVHRCINHSMEELSRGTFEAQHLIRCESIVAGYHEDPENKRCSVTIPYENPPAGQPFSTYIYKFACFSSCSGGPNRRPLTLVFTLEQGDIVIGRCSMDLKICACPGRDRDNEEKVSLPSMSPLALPKKPKLPMDGIDKENENNLWSPILPFMPKKPRFSMDANIPKMTDCFTSKKRRSLPAAKENRKKFRIEVEDEDCHRFLMLMKNFYNVRRAVKKIPQEYKAFFKIVRSSSDEDEKSSSQ